MKRKINLFFHHIRMLFRNQRFKQEIRFSLFSLFLFAILVLGISCIKKTIAYYDTEVNLSLDIQTAMFVIEEGKMSFNIDLNQIIPQDDSYIYTFSISNFNEDGRTDVDLEYQLTLQTTTNLPLTYHLYYNSYDSSATDIISKRETLQDEDGSWYHLFTVLEPYEFSYQENKTNIYYLVIDFPEMYKESLEYSDAIENIQVIIDAKQII